MTRIVLASASPRRKELLGLFGVAFEVIPPEVDEAAVADASPKRLVRRLAALKAREVAARNPDALVIGADTVVALGGKVMGKPRDAARAKAMLRALSGRTHTVYTGVCLARRGGLEARSFVEAARVSFAWLSAAEIDAYVDSGEPMDKAGAYGAQGRGGLFVRRVEGDWTTVVGLPVCRLREALKAMRGI